MKVGKVDIQDNYTSVYLNGPWTSENQYFTSIFVDVSKFEFGYSNYKYSFEDLLRSDSSLTDFKILDRMPVTISGESGEVGTYFITSNPKPHMN